MQFNLNDDSNLYGYEDGDVDFEFPSNIKQMGCIDNGMRIYMEDYVYTYLYQYAKTNGNQEKLAALVGRHMVIDGENIIIISGAIQGKATVRENGVETFSSETWNYINTQMDIYFKGLSILGWMHTQPGFGAFLMSRDEIFHREYFKNKWQVLYVYDPIEKLDTFFVHNSENTGLRAAKGYFIYYSKNEHMQDYMLDNSVVKPKITNEEQRQLNMKNNVDSEECIVKSEVVNERIDAAAKIRKVLNSKLEEDINGKHRYSLLAGISGMLCLVCIMMGAGLIHSQDRISRLESEVVTVKTSYNSIVAQIDHTQAVFAAQAETVSQATETETPKESAKVIVEEPKEEVSMSEAVVEEEKVVYSDIPDFYEVEAGDNLGYISRKFYGTSEMMDRIMAVNNISDPDKIFYGKKLKLPKS